jgi:hypothetical protein
VLDLSDVPTSLVFLVIGALVFLIITLATGEIWIDGSDESVERSKQPLAYWGFVLVLTAFITFGVFLMLG